MSDLIKEWRIEGKDRESIFMDKNEPLIDRVKQYYMKDGEIRSIRLLDKFLDTLRFAYALVEIEDIGWRMLAIFKELYSEDEMKNHLVLMPISPTHSTVVNKWTEFTQQSQSPPPNHDDPRNILNILNNDCLGSIFEHLDPSDLHSASDVCVRFREVINRRTWKQFSEKPVYNRSLLSFENCLQRFNAQIKLINLTPIDCIVPEMRSEDFFELGYAATLLTLITYFTDNSNTLNSLSIEGLDIHRVWNPFLTPIFAHLKELKLINCCTFDLLFHCKKLKAVTLDNWVSNDFITAFNANSFENLEEIALFNHSIHIPPTGNIYPAMKKLRISRTTNTIIEIFFALQICLRFPNLESLLVEDYAPCQYRVNQRLSIQLPELKKLYLRTNKIMNNLILCEIVRGKSAIRWLWVNSVDLETLTTISNMRGIKVLKLDELMENFFGDLLTMLKHLPELNELYLRSAKSLNMNDIKDILEHATKLMKLNIEASLFDSVISEDDFDKMVEFVKECGQEKGLKVEIIDCFDKVTVNVSKEKREKNRNYFEIKVGDYTKNDDEPW